MEYKEIFPQDRSDISSRETCLVFVKISINFVDEQNRWHMFEIMGAKILDSGALWIAHAHA